jgi:hypothetical protein
LYIDGGSFSGARVRLFIFFSPPSKHNTVYSPPTRVEPLELALEVVDRRLPQRGEGLVGDDLLGVEVLGLAAAVVALLGGDLWFLFGGGEDGVSVLGSVGFGMFGLVEAG